MTVNPNPISLLPGNRTQWELAESLTSAERRPIDADIIRRFYDPWTCPEHLLGYLAFQRSVDLWNHDWPVEKKRSVIARAPEMHRRKRTLAGLREYVDIAGGTVVHAIVPPQRFVAGKTMTTADFEAWLRRLPELRVYFKQEHFARQREAVAGRPAAAVTPAAGRLVARIDRARAYLGRHPKVFDPLTGQETSLRIIDIDRKTVDLVEQISEQALFPGTRGPAFVAGRSYAGRSPLSAPTLLPRAVSYTIQNVWSETTATLHVSMVAPGLAPVDTRFSRIPVLVTVPGAFVAGRSVADKGAVVDPKTEMAFYDRIHLYDERRPVPAIVNGGGVAGRHRVGMAPHTAEALIRLDELKLSRKAIVAGKTIAGMGHATKDPERWREITSAIRMNNLIDRIYCDFRITRPLVWSDRPVPDGSRRFDERLPRERI